MIRSRGSAPSWLYSFVDLAFLLLLALTQLDVEPVRDQPDLAELRVPEVASRGPDALPVDAAERSQVRVLPPDPTHGGPFVLVANGEIGDDRLDGTALRAALADLRAARAPVPILAPHAESMSGDLMEAVAAVEDLWPSRRAATVAPVPDVSAGP